MKAFRACIALLMLMSAAGAAAVGTAPRMWRVSGADGTGGPALLFLLGVTHNGLEEEYDAYFDERVLPAFERADHFSFEDASVDPATLQPCARALTSARGRAALDGLRAHLIDLVVRNQQAIDRRFLPNVVRPSGFAWRDDAEKQVEGLSEFGMGFELRVRRNVVDLLEGRTRRVVDSGRTSVARTLAVKRPGIVAASLDTSEDLVSAYCASEDQRIAAMESAVQGDRALDEPGEQSQSEIDEELDRNGSALLASFAAGRPVGALAVGQGDAIVCVRNGTWLRRMTNPAEPGPWFYAVGVAHLFPVAGSGASCAGLLADLREAGWRVDPVAADLRGDNER